MDQINKLSELYTNDLKKLNNNNVELRQRLSFYENEQSVKKIVEAAQKGYRCLISCTVPALGTLRGSIQRVAFLL